MHSEKQYKSSLGKKSVIKWTKEESVIKKGHNIKRKCSYKNSNPLPKIKKDNNKDSGALNIKPQPGEKRASLIASLEQQVTYEMLHHRKAEKEKCNLSSSRTKRLLHLSRKLIWKYTFQFQTHDCFSYARNETAPSPTPPLSRSLSSHAPTHLSSWWFMSA